MSTTKNTLSVTELLLGMVLKLPRLEAIVAADEALMSINPNDHLSIGYFLEENAVLYRDRPAIYFEDISYTHFEFNALINQYANYFISQGIEKGTVAVVFLENRLATVILIAALAKIGAVASLINANQRGKVLTHSINTDKGKYFLIGEERIEAFEAIRPDLDLSVDVVLYGIENKGETRIPEDYLLLNQLIVGASRENPTTTKAVTLADRFANVFTSGTTGMPKASIQTHLKWYVCKLWYGNINMGLDSNDVMYVPIPFFHTNALIVAWPSAASTGAAMAIRRKLSISNFWKDVFKYDVSAFIYIGEICRYLMNKPQASTDHQHRIRKIVGNGLRPDIWKAFKQRFNIPEVYELYGASDSFVSFTNVFNLDCTIGLCRADYAIVQYDVDQDEPYRNEAGFMEKVSPGEAGLLLGRLTEEVHLPGYVNRSRNQERIIENVFETGDQWFNTGDLIRDIGYFHGQFVDRLGDTFRWKGENVSTAELEAIINKLPNVAHSAVYGVALPHIDGRAGMVTITSQVDPAHFDFSQFVQALKDQLPSYAVPLFLRFIPEFEKTATHKIKKALLKKEGIRASGDQNSVYVLLPGEAAYTKLTADVFAAIEKGEILF